MSSFQWDESHIYMFIELFNNRAEDIDGRTVQSNFRSFQRRKRVPKLYAQDYRNLMRLIVRNKFARVTNSCFTSKRYRIKLVTDDYPYERIVFDEELFCHPWLNDLFSRPTNFIENIFPVMRLGKWDSSYQSAWDTAAHLPRAYLESCMEYNSSGGDFHYKLLGQEVVITSNKIRDFGNFYYQQVNYYICQYRAFKLAKSEIETFFAGSLHDKEITSYNSCFIMSLYSTIAMQFLVSIDSQAQEYNRAIRTLSNNVKRILGDGGTWNESGFDPSDELKKFLELSLFWKILPSISSNPAVIEAVQDCEKAFLDAGYATANVILSNPAEY
jgi:hypothetical protein